MGLSTSMLRQNTRIIGTPWTPMSCSHKYTSDRSAADPHWSLNLLTLQYHALEVCRNCNLTNGFGWTQQAGLMSCHLKCASKSSFGLKHTFLWVEGGVGEVWPIWIHTTVSVIEKYS